jgi:phage terminase large subunit GpA-like protein
VFPQLQYFKQVTGKSERLLKKVVADVYDTNAKKLSAAIHELATQTSLLKLRCEGLESALVNEKKKRQRQKPLQIAVQAPEHGGAVFYSPNKIQQALQLHDDKEKAIELAKASKKER